MTVVLKIGGSILSHGYRQDLIRDIKDVLKVEPLVIVHGGGMEVTKIAEGLGKKQVFIVSPEGIRSRYTDRETAAIYTMVMSGKINKELVASLCKNGVKAVGLSGVDGELLVASRKTKLIAIDERGRKRVIEGGYTGKIIRVNTDLLRLVIGRGFVPVVAPAALGEEYEFLNVDGDRAAASIAGNLPADKLVFLTDVEGVIIEGKLVERMTEEEARRNLSKIGFGMEKKVLASIEAVQRGVGEAIIASGEGPRPLTRALEHHACTVISK